MKSKMELTRFVIYEKENPNFVLKFLREGDDSEFY